MHALHDHPYLHGAYGDHLHHVSYFLSPVTRERVRATASAISCRRTSARCRSCCAATRNTRSCSPPRRHPTGTATCRWARTPTTPRASSARCRSSSRSTRTCRARSARTRCTSARSSGYTEVDYPLVEVPPPADLGTRPPDRGARRRAGTRRRDDPGGHRRDPERDPRPVARPPRPRAAHRVDLRRRHGPVRIRRAHRHAQGDPARQAGRDVRARHASPLRLPARQQCGRVLARRLGQRPARDRSRARASCRSTRPWRSTCSGSATRR